MAIENLDTIKELTVKAHDILKSMDSTFDMHVKLEYLVRLTELVLHAVAIKHSLTDTAEIAQAIILLQSIKEGIIASRLKLPKL